MMVQNWDTNTWKMTTLGLLLVGATTLVITLLMGYRIDPESGRLPKASMHSVTSTLKVSMVSQIDVDVCNAYARQRAGDKGMEVVKDATVDGLNESKKNDAGYQTAYRSCMHQKGY